MRSAMVVAAMLMMAAAGGAQTPAPELKVGDQAPDFNLQASDGKTYKLSDFKGKQAVVLAWFPKAFTAGLHDRVQVARGARRHDQEVQRDVLHGERGPDRGREGQQGVCRGAQRRFPAPERSHQETAEDYGVLNADAASPTAGRSTSARTGRSLAIDKAVKPATSAEDMAAKLGELKVEPAKPSQH